MVQDHLDLVCVCAVLTMRMDQAGMDDDNDDTQAWSFDTNAVVCGTTSSPLSLENTSVMCHQKS